MDVNLILHLIPLIVGAAMHAYPELEGATLRQQIDGDLRHATRAALGLAGFLVDVLWDYAPTHDLIGQAVANEVDQVEAQRRMPGETGATRPLVVAAGAAPKQPLTDNLSAAVRLPLPDAGASGEADSNGDDGPALLPPVFIRPPAASIVPDPAFARPPDAAPAGQRSGPSPDA